MIFSRKDLREEFLPASVSCRLAVDQVITAASERGLTWDNKLFRPSAST